MRCPKCTAENPVGARFCGVCGTRLSDETQTSGHGLHELHGHHERPPGRNRTPLVVAVAVAVLIAVVAGLLYADVRGDLRSAEGGLEEARTNADELTSALSDTREELRAAQDELTESREAFDRSSRCLARMFDAWYSTLDLSLTATGFALARAVQSEVCQMPRAAYERST
jgi:hypothetical protein